MPRDARTARPWSRELWALGVPVAATALAGALFGQRSPTDVAMVYLLGIVTVSLNFGFWTGIANAILSVLSLDVLFVPPYFTRSVQQMQHVVTFGVMLLVAVVVGRLRQRIDGQVALVRQSEQRTARLHAMARDLSRTDDPEELARLAVRHVEEELDARVVLRTDAGDAAPETTEAAAAERAEEGTFRLELRAAAAPSSPLGSLTLSPRDPARLRDPEERQLAEAFANQLAVALERARLAREAARARVQIETERLRSTLLSAISHDLRTPLAVMKGAASTLADTAGTLSEPARAELCDTLLEETARLERVVTNTLEMTRLEAGLAQARSRAPDVILLDLMLPDGDGIDVARELRAGCRTPIVVLSARGQEEDKIRALDAGADDYLTKPFSVGELLARIRVALRHAAQVASGNPQLEFTSGDLRVDLAARRVFARGQEVHLTPTEYRLLVTLVEHAGHVVTHRQLLSEAWGVAHAGRTHYVRVYMGQLRAKIEADPARPRLLLNEPGVGYGLAAW